MLLLLRWVQWVPKYIWCGLLCRITRDDVRIPKELPPRLKGRVKLDFFDPCYISVGLISHITIIRFGCISLFQWCITMIHELKIKSGTRGRLIYIAESIFRMTKLINMFSPISFPVRSPMWIRVWSQAQYCEQMDELNKSLRADTIQEIRGTLFSGLINRSFHGLYIGDAGLTWLIAKASTLLIYNYENLCIIITHK